MEQEVVACTAHQPLSPVASGGRTEHMNKYQPEGPHLLTTPPANPAFKGANSNTSSGRGDKWKVSSSNHRDPSGSSGADLQVWDGQNTEHCGFHSLKVDSSCVHLLSRISEAPTMCPEL